MRRERLVAQCTPCSSAKPQSTSRVDRRDASVSSVERAVSGTGRSVAEPLKRRRNHHLCSTATLAASVRNSTKKFPRSNEAHKIACVGTRSTASPENNVTHATGARKTQADILVKDQERTRTCEILRPSCQRRERRSKCEMLKTNCAMSLLNYAAALDHTRFAATTKPPVVT